MPRPSYFADRNAQIVPLPDEIDPSLPIREGGRYEVVVNAYERDPRARALCIAHYGTQCYVCGFSFGEVYGLEFDGYIHVHHLQPIASIGEEYEVDPVADLRPVCPNCHAAIHRRTPPHVPEELRELLGRRRRPDS